MDLDQEISTEELAELIGLSSRRVSQLAREGRLQRLPTGGFSLLASMKSYTRHLRDQIKRSSASPEQRRVQAGKARLLELAVAQKEGALMDLQEAIDYFDLGFGMLRSRMFSVPARFFPGTSNLDQRRALEALITTTWDNGILTFTEAKHEVAGDAAAEAGAT